MDDRTGQQIGNYWLLRKLGDGSSAVVYLGEHLQRHSQVAIKILHTKLMVRERDAFFNEIRTVAQLDHPAIIHVQDWGIEDGNPYIVMDYAAGGTLRQRYPKGQRLPLGLVMSYVNQLAAALHYVHEQHLIHRDVRPENILLGRDNQVLLGDFGLALISSASITQGSLLGAGSIAYMAREQIMGKSQPASDQYALAVVVYEWLAGEQLFQGSLAELSAQHLYAPPPPLQEKNPLVSSALEDVLIKALTKDPAQRFASIQDFATALTQSVPADLLAIPSIVEDEDEITLSKDASIASAALPVLNSDEGEFFDVDMAAQDDPDKTNPSLPVPVVAVREDDDALVETDKRPAVIVPKPSSETEAEPTAVVHNEHKAILPAAAFKKLHYLSAWKPSIWAANRKIAVAVALIALLLVGSVAYAVPRMVGKGFGPVATPTPVPPPLTAAITITPQQKGWNKIYSLSAITGTPHAVKHQVQARVLSVTTSAQARTVKASGVRVMPGTGVAATGSLTFDNTAPVPLGFPAGTVLTNMLPTAGAAQVALNAALIVPAASPIQPHVLASVAAHVVKIGVAGNIAAGQFMTNGTAGGAAAPNWSVVNPAAFAGGADEQTYTYVKQSDIDTSAAALIQASAPVPAQVLKPEIPATDRLVGSGQCTSNQQADHSANEKAATVTVSVWFTCGGNLYDYSRSTMLTASLLREDMQTAHYTAMNTIKTTIKQQKLANEQGTIALRIQAQARGVYYFDDVAMQTLAHQLAGKSMSEATSWLKQQPGISQATIKLSGGTGKQVLPTRTQSITIAVAS